MPRVSIPVTDITRAGIAQPAQTNGDTSNNHYLAYNDGRLYLEAVSTDAGSQNVTIETPLVVDGLALAELVVAVPAGATRLIGPFPPGIYNQADGTVSIDVTVSTTVKFRAYHLP